MIRIYLICEGQTEETFVRDVLSLTVATTSVFSCRSRFATCSVTFPLRRGTCRNRFATCSVTFPLRRGTKRYPVGNLGSLMPEQVCNLLRHVSITSRDKTLSRRELGSSHAGAGLQPAPSRFHYVEGQNVIP
jgi:hypothetical protein